jgi:glutathione S-transferase
MAQHVLYGDSRSGNCYKAAMILRLTHRPFEWRETDVMSGATRTPGFLALNPNGKVPLLVLPDGRPLAESNAMLLHLAEGTPYLPGDAFDRAQAYQWLFFEQYSHEPNIAVARFIVKLARREAEESERLEELRQRGHQALGVMQQHLQDRAFFAGDSLSVADIALYAYTHDAESAGFGLDRYPAVMRWLDTVAASPGMLPMEQACR